MNDIKLKPLTHENYSSNDPLPAVAGVGYSGVLSKTNSDTPNRYLLAFFVPRFCLVTQAIQSLAKHALAPFTGLKRHTDAHSDHGGLTSQNTKAIWRICGAVTVSTESETRHPLNLTKLVIQSVASTQKLIGGHHHA